MERDSSDEEDDRENLIESNERKNLPRSTFDIVGDFHNRRRNFISNFNFSSNNRRRYLFFIFLAIFLILVVYLSFIDDFGRNLFSSTCVKLNSSPSKLQSDRMREAELQALNLLREQQLGLLTLWNHHNVTDSSSLQDLVLKEGDLRSVVVKQIKLNKQIQEALLSSHQLGNVSELLDDSGLGSGYQLDRCRKVDDMTSKRRTIEWNPKSNKYLFAICVSGQMSNHLICLEKHMFFAALLNRVLVIPSSKVDYQYDRVLDIDHINKCFGRKVVVSFEEFSQANKNHMRIDRFICYVSLPTPCYVDEEHVKKLKLLGLSMGKLEPAWVEDIKDPKKRNVEDITSKFSSGDDVLAIGDVFYADVEQEWVMQPGGPLASKCRTLIEPSRLIMLTAQRFIQTFLGKNFVALHFRRHGFLKFCNAKKPSCFFPIPQAADCITEVVERVNAAVIYLSTDAAPSETDLLQSLIVLNGKVVPLVKRPARNSAEKWDALLYRHGLDGDSQVEAMLDKTISAMSSVFIGASGSTFTEDILRLRKDWGSASVCDEYLCQAQLPNFIADNE